MKELIVSVLGSYEPLTYIDADGAEIVVRGASGIDFEWLGGLVIFSLFIYGTIILIRSVFK